MIEIKGRAATMTVLENRSETTIRIDSTEHPDFWCEIQIRPESYGLWDEFKEVLAETGAVNVEYDACILFKRFIQNVRQTYENYVLALRGRLEANDPNGD